MKNYKTINEAIAVAEDLLKTTKQNYENLIGNREWDIKYQICDYIYRLLREANFLDIGKICSATINPPIESHDVTFTSGSYRCDGVDYQYQLFIQDYLGGKISRIYFNKEDYYESTTHPITELTLIALVKDWDELKIKLSTAIDKAYQKRIIQIKKEANNIKRKQEILNNFKL
jgi:hypothetical protein